jgi:hypothetical protein
VLPQPPAATDPQTPPVAPAAQPAGQSSSTVQGIWQVQVAGCLSGCDGIVQLQSADQQNLTAVSGPSSPPVAGAAPLSADAAPPSATSSSIAQIQLGCQQYCFGDGPTIAPPTAAPGDSEMAAGLSALPQLLTNPSVLGQLLTGPAGLQQLLAAPSGLQQLLPALAPAQQLRPGDASGSPGEANAIPGTDANAVDQSSYQAQLGGAGTPTQTQIALQLNATLQGWPALLADGAGAGPNAVNQATQGIWQLQVGCIFYCTHTEQVQQAAQADTLLVAASGGPTASVPVANTTVMRIWQLQIGCLFWCYATVQVQAASAVASTVIVAASPPPDSGAPSAAGSSSTPAPGVSVGDSGASSALVSPPTPAAVSPPAPAAVAPPGPAAMAPAADPPTIAWPSGPATRIGAPRVVPVPVPTVPGAVARSRALAPVSGPLAAAQLPGLPAALATAGSAGAPSRHQVLATGDRRLVTVAPSLAVTAAHMSAPVRRAGGAISPSPLLLALAAAAVLLVIAAGISVSRGAHGRRV